MSGSYPGKTKTTQEIKNWAETQALGINVSDAKGGDPATGDFDGSLYKPAKTIDQGIAKFVAWYDSYYK